MQAPQLTSGLESLDGDAPTAHQFKCGLLMILQRRMTSHPALIQTAVAGPAQRESSTADGSVCTRTMPYYGERLHHYSHPAANVRNLRRALWKNKNWRGKNARPTRQSTARSKPQILVSSTFLTPAGTAIVFDVRNPDAGWRTSVLSSTVLFTRPSS
jgi:hypothetical protein